LEENPVALPEMMIKPVRDEVTRMGLDELRSAEEVDAALHNSRGTVLVAVNSMCGCAAGRMRPAVAQAIQHNKRPDRLTTVFAGQDHDATARAREYFKGYPPSSPSVAILKDGALVYMLERKDIERRHPSEIAAELVAAFDQYC
jgi:putative YphP/YqiW family bacilliredoxin